MRLSHWDFRPKQRRKYVAAGTADGHNGPRRTALRILLLAAAGGLVYLKYDDFIQSPALQKLRNPDSLWQAARERVRPWLPLGVAKAPPSVPATASEAGRLEWTCASAKRDSCLEAWALPSEMARGAVRAALRKAQTRTGFPELSGFSAVFQRVPQEIAASESWELTRVVLVAGDRTLDWASLPDGTGALRWCAHRAGNPVHCPAESDPRPPVRRFASAELRAERPPVLGLRVAADEAVRPVLPGRILDLPRGPEGWLKVHHGGTLFSYYSGFARLQPGLAAGLPVDEGDTLGFAGPPQSALPASAIPHDPAAPSADTVVVAAIPASSLESHLLLRIEKDGSPVDPQAYLGLTPAVAAAPGDGGVPHVR